MRGEAKPSASLQDVLGALLAFVGPLIAVGVPILYVIGRAYKEAYWARIQLPISLMQYGIEDYLYWGFAAVVNSIFRVMSHLPWGVWGSTLMTVLALALLVAIVAAFRKSFTPAIRDAAIRARAKVEQWEANRVGWFVGFVRPFALLTYWLIYAYMYFFGGVFIVGVLILFAYHAGNSQADIDVQKIKAAGDVGAYDARAIVHLDTKNPEEDGVLLECSSEWCVILRRGQFVAIRSQDVIAIDHCPNTEQLPNGAVVCDDLRKVSI